ncbi:MAG: hypothetical protein ABIK89_15640 [Planctomycetota bacterium]
MDRTLQVIAMLKESAHSSRGDMPETLIFLHVPKTAGISVSQTIIPHFPAAETYHVRSPDHAKAPVFSENHGTIDDFKRLPEIERSRYRCILGHMHFGLHEHVPGPSAYVALLRDPVDRLLSHFGQYCRMVENDEFGDDAVLPSLEEFCREKPRAMDNHQIRFLCGWNFDDHPRQESLDRAKENLRRWFRVVGTVERFDETVGVLHRVYGWPEVARFRENVGTDRLHRKDVDPGFLAEITELNWLDRELHALADSLLDVAIAEHRESPSGAAGSHGGPRRPFFLRRALDRVLRRT